MNQSEDTELRDLASLFRYLRDAWFWEHVASPGTEREWETEEQEERRHTANLLLKDTYDRHTEQFIQRAAGTVELLLPQCAADVWRHIVPKEKSHDAQS